ncbi:MAG TPA: hypothetical protein DCF67_07455 [Brevundimonas sp.]|nr:hypothetical protein [Brevundimonas sp.]
MIEGPRCIGLYQLGNIEQMAGDSNEGGCRRQAAEAFFDRFWSAETRKGEAGHDETPLNRRGSAA